MTILTYRRKITTTADFLLQRRNPQDGGWPLNIEAGLGVSSIVNTAEALFVISQASRKINGIDLTRDYLLKAVARHTKTRGNHLRYLSYGIQGLLDTGMSSDNPSIIALAQLIESRFVPDRGWSEDPSTNVRLWSTFHAMNALCCVYGQEYIERKYGKVVSALLDHVRNNQYRAAFDGNKPSLAATSYVCILADMVFPGTPHVEALYATILDLFNEALQQRELMEVEAVPGTDWHHYSFCWALRACYRCQNGPISQELFDVTVRVLSYIDSLYREGRGFVEPGKDFPNVRSNYNVVLGLDAIIKGFDPINYHILTPVAATERWVEVQRSVFVSYSFSDADRELVKGLKELLQFNGYTVLTGEKNPMGPLSTSILDKIRQAEKVVVVMTCRDKKEDGSYTTSSWLLEEKGAAIALGKPCLVMAEEGIDPKQIGGIHGDHQRLHFTRNNFTSKVADALRMLG